MPPKNRAFAEAIDLLEGGEFPVQEFENGAAEYLYYDYIPPQFIPAPSISEANSARLNLFREDLDEMRDIWGRYLKNFLSSLKSEA